MKVGTDINNGIIMNRNLIYCASVLSLMSLASCSIDDRYEELTASYHGTLTDSETGGPVYTEYYGASLLMADTEGDINQPISSYIRPDGTYSNAYVYPSRYKVYAQGPFFECDTLIGTVTEGTDLDIYVLPNIRLEIIDTELEYGIALTVRFRYEIVDQTSASAEIGLIYGNKPYPGQRETTSGEKQVQQVTEKEGEISQTIYLDENSTYYVRALGHTSNAGDWWNYSDQICVSTNSVDISGLPVEATAKGVSATSAILDWSFPPVVEAARMRYTDSDGESVDRTIPISSVAWVAGLLPGQENEVTVNLIGGGVSGPDNVLKIKTGAMSDVYMDDNADPYWFDVNMKYSMSRYFAELWAPQQDPGWTTSAFRHEFLDWWRAGGIVPNHDNLPLNSEMSEITELSVYGNITTLLDLLPCVNIEVLHILSGDSLFSTGEAISPDTDLSPLSALKKLKTVHLGAGIPLDEDDFRNVGISDNVQIIKD